VARQHGAYGVLLAAWKKGKAPLFFSLHPRQGEWTEIAELGAVFAK